MKKDTKILVLSVPSWNSKVGSNTWTTLLEGTDPDKVANISLRCEIPDSKVCNNYFCISENKIIKSIFNRKIKTGNRVHPETEAAQSKDAQVQNNRYARMKKHSSFIPLLIREVLWFLGRWKTPELKEFITDFSPDVILYSMEKYIHYNRICIFSKKITGAKSIGFFWDDNFTYKQTNDTGMKILRFFQRKSLKKMAKQTNSFWAITPTTKREADETFGIDSIVLTKPLSREPVYQEQEIKKPISILYTGNLQIGRDRSLFKIVNALKEINKDETEFVVDVYSKTILDEKIRSQIECDFCRIHEPIPQEEVLKLQKEANILLFLEDIDGPDAQTARLSFSTKITDYLSSGKCIFAVGCPDTAPMKYFEEENSAIIASDEKEMKEKFREILQDKNILNEYAKKACECGLKNHKKEEVLRIFRKTIDEML